jgi:hypothetical protein
MTPQKKTRIFLPENLKLGQLAACATGQKDRAYPANEGSGIASGQLLESAILWAESSPQNHNCAGAGRRVPAPLPERAAYEALLTGRFPDPVTITLPNGMRPSFALALAEQGQGFARAGIVKVARW